ncbi:endonuclease/exonuclease/phosphatase family protein [Planctomycetaceae bacterium SH139]
MNYLRIIVFILSAWTISPCIQRTAADDAQPKVDVLAWNIWRGGREDGEQVGPQRVVDVIRDSRVDLVALQETYGSGELIAEALGFHLHARGTNVSILSRYPVVEDISVFEEFKCVGALIELPDQTRVAMYSIWLPFDGEIWQPGTRDVRDVAGMLRVCAPSAEDLSKLYAAIESRLAGEQYAGVPVIIAGDFNSMSHLDYSEVARDQYQAVVDWPTSRILIEAGFRDAYRELNPQIDRLGDRTWTPRFPEQEADRIDFVYYRGDRLAARAAKIIDSHAERFPSDHAAVYTRFELLEKPPRSSDQSYRAVSYNIKHCRGMDNKVDVARTADRLAELAADFIALQEVDLRAKRSGSENQAAELGRRLGMHAAFGAFMDFQGGQYGMGILSRYPFRHVQSIRLPTGNEPRIALAAEVRMPGGESIMVVSVHFDWVGDDAFRFRQAEVLADYLRGLNMPYLLLGDFNDQPGSRTLELFQAIASEVKKPAEDRFTFSSTEPKIEIDFIFTAPRGAWSVEHAKVIDEPLVSDHRPVLAELRFHPAEN